MVRALGCSAMLQRVQHRPGRLALAQIAGHRLAQHFFGGGQVEHIIDNLKRHTEISAVVGQLLLIGLARLGQDSAQLHAYGEQARRLAEDQLEVLFDGDDLSQPLDLQQFALDHGLGQIDQRVEHLEVSFLDRDFEGLHVEPVARQHALRVAPLGVGGRTAAPRLGLVDDVVVNQRRCVNDLDHGAQPDRALARCSSSACRKAATGQDAGACRRRPEDTLRFP